MARDRSVAILPSMVEVLRKEIIVRNYDDRSLHHSREITKIGGGSLCHTIDWLRSLYNVWSHTNKTHTLRW